MIYAAVATDCYITDDYGLLRNFCRFVYFYILIVHLLFPDLMIFYGMNINLFSLIVTYKKEIVYSFINIQPLNFNSQVTIRS